MKFTPNLFALLLFPQEASGGIDRGNRAPGIGDEDRQGEIPGDADEPAVCVCVVDVFGRAGLAEHVRDIGEAGRRPVRNRLAHHCFHLVEH